MIINTQPGHPTVVSTRPGLPWCSIASRHSSDLAHNGSLSIRRSFIMQLTRQQSLALTWLTYNFDTLAMPQAKWSHCHHLIGSFIDHSSVVLQQAFDKLTTKCSFCTPRSHRLQSVVFVPPDQRLWHTNKASSKVISLPSSGSFIDHSLVVLQQVFNKSTTKCSFCAHRSHRLQSVVFVPGPRKVDTTSVKQSGLTIIIR